MNRLGRSLKFGSFWRVAVLVLVLRFASGQTSFVAYFIIAMYGTRGPRQAAEALLLSWFITMANANIFGSVAGGSLGRYISLFVVSGTVLLRFLAQRSTRVGRFVFASLLLGSYMIIHSVIFSPMVMVSLLKGVTWTLATLSISLSMASLSSNQFQLFEKNVYSFLALVTCLCIPTYLLFPGGQMIGYGFLRGMLGHSQATGALAALLAIWSFSRILDNPHRPVIDFTIFGTGFATAFLSNTRTAVVAIVVAMIAVLLAASVRNRRPLQQLLRSMSTPVVALGVMVVLIAAIVNSASIFNSFSDFLSKNSGSQQLLDAYEMSRGALIDRMFDNIANYPIFGIGFGIASDPDTMIVESIAGIPVSALVEKGVAHIAIWEELGIFGLLFYLFWSIVILSYGFRANTAQFGVLIVIFLLNFGDAYIFSVGGMGLLLLVLIGFSSYRHTRDPLRGEGLSPAFGQSDELGYARLR